MAGNGSNGAEPSRIELPQTPFWRAFLSPAQGVLTWPAFDRMWQDLSARAEEGWFAFDNPADARDAPEHPLDADGFANALSRAREVVSPWRGRSHFGLVYADDLERPTFLRVFDPRNLGSSCSISDGPVLPAMILSLLRPDPVRRVPLTPVRPGLAGRIAGRLIRGPR